MSPRAEKPPKGKSRPRRTTKSRPPHPGEEERVAERRAKALRLRKAGSSYRDIARQCRVDVATAHGDVHAELGALRALTQADAADVKALELERLDAWLGRLESKGGLRDGDPRAVQAALRISERRARLQGLDAKPEGVPVEQVATFVRAVTALVLEIVADRAQADRFVAGMRRLVQRSEVIDVVAAPGQ